MSDNPRTEPFCWQAKAARRLIRTSLDATNDTASTLGVYDALTEIASDNSSEEFLTTLAWIGNMSGYSKRTVQKRLADLEQLKLVEIKTPSLRAPSTYRLLPCGNGCATSGNGCRTISNGCHAHGKYEVPNLPPSEEIKKKNRNPQHHIFIKMWGESFKATFGTDYAFQGGKDAKAVERLLVSSKLSPDELIKIARKAWIHQDQFIQQVSADISKFASQFNSIRAAVNPLQVPQVGSSPKTEHEILLEAMQ